jgi:hypothetical protein
MKEMRIVYKILVGPPGEHARNLSTNENIKTNPKEMGCGLDLNDSKRGSVVGSCVHGNEPSSFTKGRAFLSK